MLSKQVVSHLIAFEKLKSSSDNRPVLVDEGPGGVGLAVEGH